MPAWKEILSDEQVDDIIAYLKRGLAGSEKSSATAPKNPAYQPSSAPQWLPTKP